MNGDYLRVAVVVNSDDAPGILAEMCHRWRYGGSSFISQAAENPATWAKIVADLSSGATPNVSILVMAFDPLPAGVDGPTDREPIRVWVREAAVQLCASVIETGNVLIEVIYLPNGPGSEFVIPILSIFCTLPNEEVVADLGLICAYICRDTIRVKSILEQSLQRVVSKQTAHSPPFIKR